MRNSIAKRTLVALFASLMLSLSIAVFAGVGDCVVANHDVYHQFGACINLGHSNYNCQPDTYYPGDCNGTTPASSACKAFFGTQTINTYNNLRCWNHVPTCKATAVPTMVTYYGNDGSCNPESPSGGAGP